MLITLWFFYYLGDGAPVSVATTVNPTSIVINAGIGGGFRRTLINESFVQAVWPLSELVSTTAFDATGNDHDGTYNGTGFTRGVTFDIPEGALGLTFDGNGWIQVPDDLVTVTGGLSLSGGDIDICTLLKTSTSDATLRCIVCKQVTDSSGNGYFLGVQSGAVVFFCRVGGVTLFNFSRGSIADGGLHDIHAIFDTSNHEAWIEIDGAISGAKVTGITATDPAYAAADVYIGQFTNAAGRFIGTLSYVMLGREGNLTLGAELHATRTWTAITGDVLQPERIEVDYGIRDNGIEDRVASTGTMTFALDNSASNSAALAGYYSPGHANCRSGWQEGVPVRLEIAYGGVTYYKFRGRVANIEIIPGVKLSRRVLVTCVDYMDVLANDLISTVAAVIDQRSDQVVGRVIDDASRPPPAVSFGTGSETFVYALDQAGSETALMTEVARSTLSERGWFYQRGDTLQGGTVVYEGRGPRQLDTTFDGTFSETMVGLMVQRGLPNVINILPVTVNPRRVDAAATTVLYSLSATSSVQTLAPGQILSIDASYVDPSQQAISVGGTDMVTPVATTDYTLNAAEDGTGVDLTSSGTVSVVFGGTKATVEITNSASVTAYLTKFQLRGRGIYIDQPVTIGGDRLRDRNSVREFGPRTGRLDLPYQGDVNVGESVGTFELALRSAPRTVATSVRIVGNSSDALMTQALAREPGDRIGLGETLSALVTTDGVFIQGVRMTIGPASTVVTEFSVDVPLSSTLPNLWRLGEVGFSELGSTTYLGL